MKPTPKSSKPLNSSPVISTAAVPAVMSPPTAWNCAIGWDHHLPRPTLADLLPPATAQKFLELWLATGTNYLDYIAGQALMELEDNPLAYQNVAESLELDLADKLDVLIEQWGVAGDGAATPAKGGRAA